MRHRRRRGRAATGSPVVRLPPGATRLYIFGTFAWSWWLWSTAAGLPGGVERTAGAVLVLMGGAGPLLAAGLVVARASPAYRAAFRRRLARWRLSPRVWAAAAAVGCGPKLLAAGTVAIGSPGRVLAAGVTLASAAGVVVFALAAGLVEEPGWRGVALDSLGGRASAALLIGLAWLVWHVPLYVVPGTFQHRMGFGSTAFWLLSLTLLPLSVLLVWLRNLSDALLPVVVAHALTNTTGELLLASDRARLVEFFATTALALWVVRSGPPTLDRGYPAPA